MINVTKTFLPPQDEYNAILKKSWDKNWMTNRGPLVQELEEKLKKYLGVPNIIATTNGTLPLQIAIKSLGLTGEIITTPFSYVASTSSIVWEGCSPVFVDIHPEYLTIDETKIEAAITLKTTAILATHVFGNPCAVEEIEIIAKKHNLKVIYDAAHCFGVKYKKHSIFNYGDISTCSFHATKLFHTGEGGCMMANDDSLNEILFDSHNFGHKEPGEFSRVGINAKMSELQAAMGLSVLPYMKTIIQGRKRVVDYYNMNIEEFTNLKVLKIREGTNWNYCYFPIIFKSEDQLQIILKLFNKESIFPRRYFYPSLSKLNYVSSFDTPHSDDIASRILCLPLSHDLSFENQNLILDIVKRVIA